jgi:hypothetical protein
MPGIKRSDGAYVKMLPEVYQQLPTYQVFSEYMKAPLKNGVSVSFFS